MSSLNLNKEGVSIIFAVFTLLLLSVVAVAIFSLISSDIESAASRVVLARALGIAEGGVQIGAQAIRDDANASVQTADPTSNGYHGIVYLEGYSYDGYGYIDNNTPDRACLHGTHWNNQTPYYCSLDAVAGANVTIWDFKQKRNLIGTRIKSVEMMMRARRQALTGKGAPGPDPLIQLEYTIDGIDWIALGDPIAITSSGWGPPSYITPILLPSPIDWNTFMNNSDNFRIRARRVNSGGRKVCQIDWLALRVIVEVDAITELWASGTYITFPAPLGNGEIESITISDESGKVHLNYATEDLLRYLMEYNGVPRNIGSAIFNYRTGGNWFDTVEELKQVPGMTDGYYESIVQDVTVYSWMNQDATRPTAPRAPVNINTASPNVLRAIFRCAIDNNSVINSLVDNIIDQREGRRPQPFTHMYSSYAIQRPTRDLTSFAGFLQDQRYLDDNQRNLILANADATFYNRDLSQDWTGTEDANQTATEFCYYSNTFLITAVGRSGDVSRTVMATYGDIYNYGTYSLSTKGTFNLPTYIEDAEPEGYWREER